MRDILVRVAQIIVLIAILILIAWNYSSVDNVAENVPKGHCVECLSDYFDGDFELVQDSLNQICKVTNAKGWLGYAMFSEDLLEQSKGFAGVTNFVLILSKDYHIVGVKVLSSEDTKSYIAWLKRDGFFDQWNGLSAKEVINKEVDVVSGASMSSSAVGKDMKSMLINATGYQETQSQVKTMQLLKNIAALLVLVFALLHFFFPKKLSKTRIVLLVLSIVVLGLWCGYFLSLALIHGWLINGVVLEMQAFLIIVLILSVVLPLFTKRAFYCTYVCPFGALQELAGKTCKRKVKISPSVIKVLRIIRPLILLVVLLLLALGLSLPLGNMEPFSIFHLKAASLVVIILASLMVIVSVFIPKFWCKYLCPTGMILELFRKPIIRKQKISR